MWFERIVRNALIKADDAQTIFADRPLPDMKLLHDINKRGAGGFFLFHLSNSDFRVGFLVLVIAEGEFQVNS